MLGSDQNIQVFKFSAGAFEDKIFLTRLGLEIYFPN